ncbi:Major facilitator superfamily domain-containing protein 6, partial [Atta colombica]
STRHRSQNLNISRTSLRRILNKDLGMKPYKVQLVQELKPHDHPIRFRFAEEDEHFYRKIIFSDEAHFHLGGYVNKQNCCLWGSKNPHIVMEKPMHPQRVTVWCGFWSGGIIGLFFFENEQGAAVIVNGERYRAMLNEFLLLKFEEEDTDDIWFQQDGAPENRPKKVEDCQLQALLDEDDTQSQKMLAELLGVSPPNHQHLPQIKTKSLRALREKRPHYRKRHDKLIFLHDNVPSHTSTMIQNGREKVFEDAELEALLEQDSWQNQEELARSWGVTQQAISKRLKAMGMIQKQENWVPYELKPRDVERRHASAIASCNGTKDTMCHWICENMNFSTQLSFHADQNKATISPNTTCLLNINKISLCQGNLTNNYNCNVICDNFKDDQCLYTSVTFWSFVVLMCISESGSFIFSSISDAFCFVILGQDKRLKYGKQRLWGAIGFGIVVCLSGYMIDFFSHDKIHKNYLSSMLLVIIFTCIDFICCIKLKLPFQSQSTTIMKDVFILLKSKTIVIFLCFSGFFGVFNIIMRNFLLWYVEDLSIATDYMDRMKLIEGLILAAQAFSGEVIFFFLSGKILKKLGYGYTFTFCFICYALRLGLISLASTPWWVLLIEFFMQGPSYALSFTAIISYANVITPTGASATVQGLVQGVNEGLGFSIGSLIGGVLFKKFGGIMTLRIISVFAAFSALIYFVFHIFYFKQFKHKTDARNNIKWRELDDAQKHCNTADI